jgi:hypothetical protein
MFALDCRILVPAEPPWLLGIGQWFPEAKDGQARANNLDSFNPYGWNSPPITLAEDESMAQPNYQYEKRQKELAKKKKKEEKLQRKSADKDAKPMEDDTPPPVAAQDAPTASEDEE